MKNNFLKTKRTGKMKLTIFNSKSIRINSIINKWNKKEEKNNQKIDLFWKSK